MKVRRWASVAAACVLVAVCVAGFLAFWSAAEGLREPLRETDANIPLDALAASAVLDSYEYALALGGLVLVSAGVAVEFLVKRRWIALIVSLGSAAVYIAALLVCYRAIAGAVGG